MQPNPYSAQQNALRLIAVKELGQLFRSPIAWLFLAAFLLVTLFVFFWVESFFARNIADIRPLFEWMPLLLIFLSAAITMRMWSEERRSGTLEHVLTQPVALWKFVLGKFFACWLLLAVALLLTLPLPITISFFGDVDWGPVFSGYVAAILLGGAYIAMGLFVSSRCDNQIVSLILSVSLAGVFYLIGSSVLTSLASNQTADLLRSMGTGSRFDSITRGMLDFRDLYYYISLIVGFIALNVFSLERGRWAKEGDQHHHRYWRWGTALLVANVVVANVWLAQVNSLRWDTTRGNLYTISEATDTYLAQLQEPLLIRGYFSQKTHPLLAPLVPQIQDLLREYEIASDGRVKVQVIDPTADPKAEDEANNTYNIKPTPFRVNDRHQASLVNSYFDILVKYGDQYQVLGFNDLIEVKSTGATDIDVRLRNPEYDVTRTIKKVLYAYQSEGDVFDSVSTPIKLIAYVSGDDKMPSELADLKASIREQAQALADKADGKFTFEFVDTEANGGAEGKRISEEYGFAPMATGLFDANTFYFYVVLQQGDQLMQIDLGDYSESSFKTSLDASIKRYAKGFTRTVALVVPEVMDPHMAMQMGRPPENKPRFNALNQLLSEDMNVVKEDISDGSVDPSADILVLSAPELSTEKERFAVDQFLMRGGTVLVATSPYSANIGRNNLSMDVYQSGISDWLTSMGVSMSNQLVMDKQNSAFPIPVVREMGGLRFQEMRMVDYPYFIDVRGDGLNSESVITADLPQVTVPWAAPITLDEDKLQGITQTPLLQSSNNAWLGSTSGVMPSVDQLSNGFSANGDTQSHLLAVALQGRFTSAFAGKDSPLVASATDKAEDAAEGDDAAEDTPMQVNQVLGQSAESARLIVFSSNDMFRDEIVNMLGAVQGGAYLNSLQMAINTVEWALEDQGLLSIRSRSHFNRTLEPMETGQQEFWEYLNYGLALFGLFVLWLVLQYQNRVRNARFEKLLAA